MTEKRRAPAAIPGPMKNCGWQGHHAALTAWAQGACHGCVFFEVIHKGRGPYAICHLTGMRDPQPGEPGCRFVAGKWEGIDDILGLTARVHGSILNFPNVDRLADGLYHSQDDKNNGIFALNSHFPCYKRHGFKLAARRPEPVKAGGLSTTGERIAAICILKNPQNVEVHP